MPLCEIKGESRVKSREDLNLGRIVFRPDNAENPLEIDPVPGMT